MKSYFGVGYIIKQGKTSVQFWVTSPSDLNKIIVHFDTCPLITKKRSDFELFKKVVEMLNCKEHLTMEGFQKIVAIKAFINKGLPDELKSAFPSVVDFVAAQVETPIGIQSKITIDPDWVGGFASGEGCFYIKITTSSSYKTGFQVSLRFSITQHLRDQLLLENLVKFFGCGYYQPNIAKNHGDFIVTKLSDLNDIILPFFDKYKIIGEKSRDFEDFKKVAELMNNKAHLSEQGLAQIMSIKSNMNKGRK